MFKWHGWSAACRQCGGQMEFTHGQKIAVDKLWKWLNDMKPGDIFRWYGYAGTGKTTALSHFMRENPMGLRMVFVTPTNKAKKVLDNKLKADGFGDFKTKTLFSLLYTWLDNPDYVDAVEMARVFHDKLQKAPLTEDEEKTFKDLCRMTRELQPNISCPRERPEDIDLIIIDEASMVCRKDAETLLEWQIPVIVMGDPFQLPPIKEQESILMGPHHNALLTEVVRQSAENKLLKFATDLRDNKPFHPQLLSGNYDHPTLAIKRNRDLDRMREASCIIAFSNQMVAEANHLCHVGKHGDSELMYYPQDGDPVMFYQNNYMKEKVVDEKGRPVMISKFDDNGNETKEQKTISRTLFDNGERVWLKGHLGPMTNFVKENGETEFFYKWDSKYFREFAEGMKSPGTREITKWYFTFGYACTVHKAQGSEFDSVYLINDYPLRLRNTVQYRRWLYTAVTRAKTKIYIEGTI